VLTPQFISDIRRVTAEGDTELNLQPVAGARVIPQKLALGPPAPPLVIRVSGDGFADIQELRQVNCRSIPSPKRRRHGNLPKSSGEI